MSKLESFENRLNKLVEILNIPLEEKWEEWTGSANYTLYKYWKNLDLLSNEDLKLINQGEGRLKASTTVKLFFKRFDSHFSHGYYTSGKVADVGSGFGFITFWLVLNGAKCVHSIGDPYRISFIQKLYTQAQSKGIIEPNKIIFHPEFVQVGDTTLAKGIENNSLSLVLLNDTLEHITPRIFPWLVKSTYNNLKHGGYFISRQQNTDSPTMLRKLIPFWEKQEENVFINQRKEFIKERLPEIDSTSLEKLARNTRGMDSIALEETIQKFKTQQFIPEYQPLAPPIDISNDVPCEGDTEIKRITSEFKNNNFQKVRVYPDLLHTRRSKYFQRLAKFNPHFFLNNHIFDATTVFRIQK